MDDASRCQLELTRKEGGEDRERVSFEARSKKHEARMAAYLEGRGLRSRATSRFAPRSKRAVLIEEKKRDQLKTKRKTLERVPLSERCCRG